MSWTRPYLIWLALVGPLLVACPDHTPRARHLLLITVDTLRADRVGAYGYGAAETATMDALAAESIRFERAYAQSSSTVPSMASLMTSRLPAELQVFDNYGSIPSEATTLAEHLRAAGFVTAGCVGNYALRRGRGFDRGFQDYTREFASQETVRPHPENPGTTLTQQAISFLASRAPGARFFLWIHYQEPHGPYTPPRFDARRATAVAPELPRSATNSGRGAIPRYQWLGHGRLGEYLARYDGEIAEVDREIGRVLGALQELDLDSETLVVLAADHGEAFGESDLYLAHGEGLDEVLVRVPLLLRGPGLAAATRSELVRLIDVAPTALDLLGIDGGEFTGHSLLGEPAQRLSAAQLVRGARRWRSIRDDHFELLETEPGARLLRNVAHSALPSPRDAEPEAWERLSRELERLAPWPARAEARGTLSAREREALRALGYAD